MTGEDEQPDDDDVDRDVDAADLNIGLGGLLGSVGELIDALSEIEQDEDGSRSEMGRLDRDSFTIDYNYDVNVGIGGDQNRRKSSRTDRSERKRTVDVDEQDDDMDHTVDVREYDDEVIVSADLPGIDEDDLDVSVEDDARTVTITVNDEVLERVPLDSKLSVRDVSFKNQILQIRLQQRDESTNE